MGEFEKHWLVLLRRRGATMLMGAVVVFAAAYSFGLLTLLLDRHAIPFLPADLLGFSATQLVTGGALLGVGVVTVVVLI